MKKAIIVVAVLALTMVSSVALADITVSGAVDFRGFANNNIGDLNGDGSTGGGTPGVTNMLGNPTNKQSDSNRFNQSRYSLTFDGKMGDAKAKLTLMTVGSAGWETWGTAVEQLNGGLGVKEGWVDFPLFGSVRAKGGHMPLMLGNGWFLRHMYMGDDAWVVYADAGGSHFGFVNIKVTDQASQANNFPTIPAYNNDSDMYALVFTQKAGDSVFGAYFADYVIAKKQGATQGDTLQNLGVHATVAAGPAKLNVEVDVQMGKNKATSVKYSGKQLVITGAVPMGAATLNFTAGSGTGDDPITLDKNEGMITSLDVTNKSGFTFVYDYLVRTAALKKNSGFSNTTALGVGADVKVGKVTISPSAFYLKASEKLQNVQNVMTDDIGTEVDLKVAVPMTEGVTWTTFAGIFMPGKIYNSSAGSNSDATSIMTVLTAAFK